MKSNSGASDGINRWIRKELQNPKAEGDGRNNQMIRVMPRMLEVGWKEQEVFDAFKKAYELNDDSSKDEIWKVMANAVNYAKSRTTRDAKIHREHSTRLNEVRRASARLLPKILSKHIWSFQQLTAGGWRKLPPSLQRRRFLDRMFRPNEVIWSGGKFDTGRRAHAVHFKTAAQWADASRGWPFLSHCSFRPSSFSRCNAAVMERRYLVVESDKLTWEEIFSLFRWFGVERGLELRAAVFSGRRSVHGWFDWPAGNDTREIGAMLEGFRCDPATIRASQPVRLAGSTRSDTRKVQELLYLDAFC